MTLIERVKAEETALGKVLANWIGKILLLCSALGMANEYLVLLPPDFVPQWVKTTIVVTGIVSFVAGKLTVKANPQG